METTENKIRKWMKENVEYCLDSNGDVNMTLLAESCANALGGANWLDDEIHVVWEIASEHFKM